MYSKAKLGYAILGAAIGIFGLAVGLCVSPLTAQRNVFGEITCTGLTVRGSDGRENIRLMVDASGALVGISDGDGSLVVAIGTDNDGGRVEVFAKDQKDERARAVLDVDYKGSGVIAVSGTSTNTTAGMYVTELGGVVEVKGKDRNSKVHLFIDELGGRVKVTGRDGISATSLSIFEHGAGIGMISKDGTLGLTAVAAEHGGQINVMGKNVYPQAIINADAQQAGIKVVEEDAHTSAGIFVIAGESYVVTSKDGDITGYLGGQETPK